MFPKKYNRTLLLIAVLLLAIINVTAVAAASDREKKQKKDELKKIQKIGHPALLVYGGPHIDMYMGAYDMHFISEAYFAGKRQIISPGGIGGRLLSIFVDLPVVTTAAVIQHEYFGHGYRGREFDLDSTIVINPPFPYNLISADTVDQPAGYAQFENYTADNDQDLMITLGGMESNLVAASVSRDLYLMNGASSEKRGLPMYFFVNRLSPLYYILIASNDDSSGDPGVFRQSLRAKYGETISVGGIRAKALTLLLDPLTFISFPVLGPYLQREILGRNLMFKVGKKTRFMPGLNYLLTPYGDEFQVDLMFKQGRRYFVVTPRFGFGIESMNGGIAFRGRRMLRISKKAFVGNHVEIWMLPKYNGGAPEKELIPGGALALQIEYVINKRFNLQLEAGYKTQGYMFGRGFLDEAFGLAGLGIVF